MENKICEIGKHRWHLYKLGSFKVKFICDRCGSLKETKVGEQIHPKKESKKENGKKSN